MALETRILKVRFNSNYSGLHRVCYREQGTINYTCSLVNCGGNGSPCEYDIQVELDNETCENVVFEGYVQAACESEASNVGRIPFVTTFEPSPRCARWRATCSRGGIDYISVTGSGNGYTTAPTVTILSATGVGATAVAVITNGNVSSIDVINSGEGYSVGDTVVISSPSSGVRATAVVAGLTPCAELELTDCDGNIVDTAYPLNQGEYVSMCSPYQVSAKGLNWEVEQEDEACICSCGRYLVTPRGGSTFFMYYDCEENSWQRVYIELGNSIEICASKDSWSWSNEDESGESPLIEYQGVCE